MKKIILIGTALSLSVMWNAYAEVRIPTFNAAGPIERGYGVAALPDSGIYKGQFADGLFNGIGEITWQNGAKYEGEFKSGLQHGNGKMTTPNGDVYRGEFYQGYESGSGTLVFANGNRYEGAFKNGMFDGKGTFIEVNGGTYTGDFRYGEFSGSGKSTTGEGDSYEGNFDKWRLNGEGVYTPKSGDRYEGHFVGGVPAGRMKVVYQGGSRYEGGMEGWNYHGEGVITSVNGDRFSGRFENGVPTGIMEVVKKEDGEVYRGKLESWLYHGKGVLTKSNGLKYDGEFKYGSFDGKGTLTTPDKRRYTGEFNYGKFDGKGTLEFLDANKERKVLSGNWRNGKYTGDDAASYVKDGLAEINAEKVMYAQSRMVEKVLSKLAPQVAGQADLYFVGFGGYGGEDVFMNEIRFSSNVMNKLYDTGGHSVSLINNPKTVDEEPLATLTNLETVLNGVAKQMDINEDILFLYVSSHGSKKHEISVALDGVSLQDITPKRLKEVIRATGIKWKVLVISSCYSGGLIEPLKDKYTLVMTASRADRMSFGCGVESRLTYFGRAFFEQSLNSQVSFVDAFAHARDLISSWEKKEKQLPSEPQIASTPLIEEKLADWRTNSTKKANLVLFGKASQQRAQ